MLKKEQLLELGIDDKNADKIVQLFQSELSGNYIPKERFDQVNSLKNDLTKQIEELKESTGNVEDLKKQISEIQNKTSEQEKAYKAEIEKMKVKTALERALTDSKAKNLKAVEGLLFEFLDGAKIGEDGKITGLDAKIKELKAGKDTNFLFEEEKKPTENNFMGTTPNSGNGNTEPPKNQNITKEQALTEFISKQIGG